MIGGMVCTPEKPRVNHTACGDSVYRYGSTSVKATYDRFSSPYDRFSAPQNALSAYFKVCTSKLFCIAKHVSLNAERVSVIFRNLHDTKLVVRPGARVKSRVNGTRRGN